MKTLGIDLASDPKKTAYCTLEWASGTAEVRELCVGKEGGPLAAADLRPEMRGQLADELLTRAAWLRLSEPQREMMRESDDALDALVASLNARAAKLGLTVKPEPALDREAAREGRIAIPAKGSLERLARERG